MHFPLGLLDSLRTDDRIITNKYAKEYMSTLSQGTYLPLFQNLPDILSYREVLEEQCEAMGLPAMPLPRDFSKHANKPAIAAASLYAHVLEHMNIQCPYTTEYVNYVLQKEAEQWLDLTDPTVTLRPRLKTPLKELEEILESIVLEAANRTLVKLWSTKLGYETLIPVIAILYAMATGLDIDDTFMHCPPTKVVGASCQWREAKIQDTKVIHKRPENIGHIAFAANGQLFLRHQSLWTSVAEATADLAVWVPGIDANTSLGLRKFIITGKKNKLGIIAVTYEAETVSISKKAELDLDEDIDYLDCQRDRDNNIVILFGKRNNNTGSVETSYMAWSEDDFMNRRVDQIIETNKLPERMAAGTKIDYRDHNNLLGLVTMMNEDTTAAVRTFSSDQAVVYGNTLLKVPTEKKLYAVYGAPEHFVYVNANGLYEMKTNGPHKLDIELPVAPKSITAFLVQFT
jgi:hypothetical protein